MKINSKNVVILPDGRLDTENAALYTGRAVKTMAMERSKGTGAKFIKRGKVFYYQADLDEWLNSGGKATSTSQHRANKMVAEGGK